MYVVSNCKSVQLLLNGRQIGISSAPTDGFLFTFPDVAWQPGELTALGINDGTTACQQVIHTAGPPHSIRLTPILGPGGLHADGADVALFDVEVIDAQGQRCPTDDARIDFSVTGPAIWRGGYNSGIINSTNNLYLNTECGINRVAVRSTRTPGTIQITASRSGLDSASTTITSAQVDVTDGLQKTLD